MILIRPGRKHQIASPKMKMKKMTLKTMALKRIVMKGLEPVFLAPMIVMVMRTGKETVVGKTNLPVVAMRDEDDDTPLGRKADG